MFKALTFSAALTISALTAGSALAGDKEGVYLNIGGTQLSTEVDLRDTEVSGQIIDLGVQDLDLTMVNGRLGYRLNEYFAVEGEFGKGFGGDTINKAVPITVGTTTVNIDTKTELDIDSYYGAFARGIFPVSE